MKSLKVALYTVLILIIITTQIHFANANPVVVDTSDTPLLQILLVLPVMLICTILLEYLIFSALTDDRTLNGSDLFKSVAIVNLFTFPITQLLALLVAIFVFVPYQVYFYLFVELVSISLEFVLFLYIFKKVLEVIQTRNSVKIFVNTLAANIITFAFGFVPMILYLLVFS
ncbi:MAG: hypothetical protein ACFE9T_09790 [Promethearchaeota archaeon]